MVAAPVPDDSSEHDLDALWRATQDRLRASVPDSTYRLWLEPLRATGSDAETLHLTAPESIRAWAERRYTALIVSALADSGTALRRVSFAPPEPADTAGQKGTELNPQYTFDRFVIGAGNRMAHGAALAIRRVTAKLPGRTHDRPAETLQRAVKLAAQHRLCPGVS